MSAFSTKNFELANEIDAFLRNVINAHSGDWRQITNIFSSAAYRLGARSQNMKVLVDRYVFEGVVDREVRSQITKALENVEGCFKMIASCKEGSTGSIGRRLSVDLRRDVEAAKTPLRVLLKQQIQLTRLRRQFPL